MTIIDLLNTNFKKYKEEIALTEINPLNDKNCGISTADNDKLWASKRSVSWGEFYSESNKFANYLISHGIKKGDKIAFIMVNCLEWLPIYFGILKSGAVAVPLSFRCTADEIKYCLEKADCTGIVFGPEFVERIEKIKNELSAFDCICFIGEEGPDFAENFENRINLLSDCDPDIKLDESDDAAIYFSSGTTGFPKAVLHTHKSLINAAITEENHHGQTHDDVFLLIPPLYHTGAKMHWFGSLYSGSRAVILRGAKPKMILNAVSEEKCTVVWLLVPWTQDILDEIERGNIDLDEYSLKQWRLMHIGAQPVPPSLIMNWKKYFPDQKYDTNYGLSEAAGPGCVHLGLDRPDKIGAIGKHGYGWKTKIVDEKFDPVNKGEVGELLVSGPGVMKCYYNDEKATNEAIRDGWLLTGDMVREDPDGFIYLVDRKKEVIISGGENIYPVQIENYLRKNEKIKDCAVIGLADTRLGEIPAAVIELKPGEILSEEEVTAFCEALPRYKRPRKVFFDDVPRNPTGKIEKTKLRNKFCK